jgi:hypothetical protein
MVPSRAAERHGSVDAVRPSNRGDDGKKPLRGFGMAKQKVHPKDTVGGSESREGPVTRRGLRISVVLVALMAAGLILGIKTLRQRDPEAQGQGADQGQPTTAIEGLPLTAENLRGIWLEDRGVGRYPGSELLRFGMDGSFSIGGVLTGDSWSHGTYAVHGGRIIFMATGGWCDKLRGPAVRVFADDAAIVADGRLEAVFAGGGRLETLLAGAKGTRWTGRCLVGLGEPLNFTRISPTSPGAADITPDDYPAAVPTTQSDVAYLDGYWLIEGTSQLLRMDRLGRYLMDDAGRLPRSPLDRGMVEIRRRELRFVSSEDARRCSAGDVMVWTSLRVNDGNLQAIVSRDSCGRDIGRRVTLLRLKVLAPDWAYLIPRNLPGKERFN